MGVYSEDTHMGYLKLKNPIVVQCELPHVIKACGFTAIETYKGACMQMSEEKRGCCCGKKTTMRSEEERD